MDVNQYIGIPFQARGRDRAGIDCWGLIRLVLEEQFEVRVPSYVDEYETIEAEKIGKLVACNLPTWTEVFDEQIQPGDVALFRVKGQPIHVGLIVSKAYMIHILPGVDACLDKFNGLRWGKRLIGIYRYDNN